MHRSVRHAHYEIFPPAEAGPAFSGVTKMAPEDPRPSSPGRFAGGTFQHGRVLRGRVLDG